MDSMERRGKKVGKGKGGGWAWRVWGELGVEVQKGCMMGEKPHATQRTSSSLTAPKGYTGVMVGIVCGPPSRTKDGLLSKAEGRHAWMCDACVCHTHPQPHSQAVPKGLRPESNETKKRLLVPTYAKCEAHSSKRPQKWFECVSIKTTPPPSRLPCIFQGWTRSSC